MNLSAAERRIEEVRSLRAATLDLGDLALSDLPASLENLPHLRILSLGRMKVTGAGKLELDPGREPSKFKDLTPLARLQGLRSLDLRGTCVVDLSPLAGLTGLQSLDLRGTGVTDLSPLAGLQGLQNLKVSSTSVTDLSPLASLRELQSLEVSSTGVADLSPLADLRGLQSLDVSSTRVVDLSLLVGLEGLQNFDLRGTGVTDLSPLAGLQGLQNLKVSSTDIADLSPLAGLQGLRSLNVSSTDVADLLPLAGLRGLQSLNVSSTGVADLSPLAGLQGLQSLDVSSTGVTDLSALVGLHGLQSLNLSSTGLADLLPLAGLQELQILDVSSTGVADLSPLAGLRRLQSFNVASTRVTDLSPLARLQELQSFNVSGTGVTDLAPLAGLPGLQSLNVWSTGVADLSPLAGLQGLRNLNVSSTGVVDLSPLAGLSGLQGLNVSSTGATDLSPLASLRSLLSVMISGCRLAVPGSLLRAIAGQPRLTNLVADEAAGVPREVLSQDRSDNCLPRLRAYFAEVDLGAETENEVKVILLGNGRVGKTQLCRRLRNEPFDERIESTHGVKIWRERLRLRSAGEVQDFQVNWWDFGGQDIYHGTHALFLRSRAVFLILWTPALENRNETEENGVPLRNQPLTYWLDYVRTFAGADSPVIVVQSQCDRFGDRRPDPPRPDGFGFFECCAYSAREDLSRDTLESHLHNALRYLVARQGALAIGHGRAELRRRLYAWRSQDQKRDPEARRHRTLTLAEFRSLCAAAGGIVSWEHALDYLHQTGVVFYRPDLFSNCIVLDQDWALAAVYTVFDRGRAAPLLRDSGRFTREDLALLVWQNHSVEEQSLFLGLMESCGVCFPCGKTLRGEQRYAAPDLLPAFAAVAGRLHAWQEEPGTPRLTLRYHFFHPAVIWRLMGAIGREAGDAAEYWKYGLWLNDAGRASQLLVQLEDTSTQDSPGAGDLVLKAQGRDPLGLLGEIRRAILGQRIGEPPDELLTREGVTVPRRALAGAIDNRLLDQDQKAVPAAAFAAFFEDREPPSTDARSPQDLKAIDIKPTALLPADNRPEVFISYAWGDDTLEGKLRDQAVEGLYAALAEEGFVPVRDRDQIRFGERISTFIRRLTLADLIVAVISDRYLRSAYCMYEIYEIWHRCRGDAGAFAKRLVPMVLPGVNIGSFAQRATYCDFWVQRTAELRTLIGDLKLRPGPESWEEARLAQQFADNVDEILAFVNDVLMERNLDRQLESHFQLVREALRRRLGP